MREGLLHVLGGGIAQMARPMFPAPIGATLAMNLVLEADEAAREHRITVELVSRSGERVGGMEVGFGAAPPPPDADVWSGVGLPLTIPIPDGLSLPRPGAYEFRIAIDDVDSGILRFMAIQFDEPTQ